VIRIDLGYSPAQPKQMCCITVTKWRMKTNWKGAVALVAKGQWRSFGYGPHLSASPNAGAIDASSAAKSKRSSVPEKYLVRSRKVPRPAGAARG
jgi:hypothetical protein